MLNQQEFENASGREEQLAMMIEELKKKKRNVKICYGAAALLIFNAFRMVPFLISGDEVSNSITSIVLMLIFAVVIPVLGKKKLRDFEADLDAQTSAEEKLLYK